MNPERGALSLPARRRRTMGLIADACGVRGAVRPCRHGAVRARRGVLTQPLLPIIGTFDRSRPHPGPARADLRGRKLSWQMADILVWLAAQTYTLAGQGEDLVPWVHTGP